MKTERRNKNGEGLYHKNKFLIYLDDEQYEFLNKLSKELNVSKNYIFRSLLRKEYEKRCVKIDVDDALIEVETTNWDDVKDKIWPKILVKNN